MPRWIIGGTVLQGRAAGVVTIVIRCGVSLFISVRSTGRVATRATIPHCGREIERWVGLTERVMALSS